MPENSTPAASTLPRITCPQCESTKLQIQDVPAQSIPKKKRRIHIIRAILYILLGVFFGSPVIAMAGTGAEFIYGPIALLLFYAAFDQGVKYRRLSKTKQFTCQDCQHVWTVVCSKCSETIIIWTPARFNKETGEESFGLFIAVVGYVILGVGIMGAIWYAKEAFANLPLDTGDLIVLTLMLGVASVGAKILQSYSTAQKGLSFKCAGCKHKWGWPGA